MKALDEQRKAGVLPAEVARVYDDLKKLGYAPDAANTNIGSAIFANKPGDGSAREQAASCQRVLGGAANFACEYATKRYRSNCINWGMLPFLVENPGALDNGDYVYLPASARPCWRPRTSWTPWPSSRTAAGEVHRQARRDDRRRAPDPGGRLPDQLLQE